MDATVAECKAAEQAARADANRRGLRNPLRLHIKGWWNKQGTQHDYCLNNWVGPHGHQIWYCCGCKHESSTYCKK